MVNSSLVSGVFDSYRPLLPPHLRTPQQIPAIMAAQVCISVFSTQGPWAMCSFHMTLKFSASSCQSIMAPTQYVFLPVGDDVFFWVLFQSEYCCIRHEWESSPCIPSWPKAKDPSHLSFGETVYKSSLMSWCIALFKLFWHGVIL